MSDPTNVCSNTSGSSQHKKCVAAVQSCADKAAGDGSCTGAVNFCTTNAAWPAKLATDKASFTLNSPNHCLLLLKLLVNKGHTPVEAAGVKFGGETETATSSHVEESKKEEVALPLADSATVEATAEPAKEVVHSPESLSKCKNVDDVNREACHAMADSCASSSTWPHQIVTTGGIYNAQSENQCLLLSKLLAGKGYELGTPKEKPEAASDDSASASATDSATGSDSSESTIEEPDFIKSFQDVNLNLHASGKPVDVKRTLHFPGGKGIPIKLHYTVNKLDSGSYTMDYTVSRGDDRIGDEQSITFDTSSGGINLGFAITLWSKNNFGSVKSISIVEL